MWSRSLAASCVTPTSRRIFTWARAIGCCAWRVYACRDGVRDDACIALRVGTCIALRVAADATRARSARAGTVAEHVPATFEDTLIANLDRHNTRGIVLSWSNARRGVGHVNYRDKSWVTLKMQEWNYTEDEGASRRLQAAALYDWFRPSRVHGAMGGGMRVWRRGRAAPYPTGSIGGS